MPAGITRVRQLSQGSARRVKKQLNDLYLFLSYQLHKELAQMGVTAVFSTAGAARADGKAQVGPLATGANATLLLADVGTPAKLSDYGRLSVLTTDPNNPTAKDWEASVTVWGTETATQVDDYFYGGASSTGVRTQFAFTVVAGEVATATGGKAYIQGQPITVVTINTAQDTVTAAGQKVILNAAAVVRVEPSTYTPAANELLIGTSAGAGPFTITPAAAALTDLSNLKQLDAAGNGRPKLAAAGELVALVCDSAVPGDIAWDFVDVVVYAARASELAQGFQKFALRLDRATGIDQALPLVDNAGTIVTDVVAIDWNKMAAEPAVGDVDHQITGAHRGLALRWMSLPFRNTDWIYHAFVRQINPNVPKDFREVADHFDGAADFIRAVTIPSLMVQKVFESVPGSFKNMRGRKCTLKAETRELNRFDSSETHYFLGVIGTPTINFQADNESISQFEATMYRWIYIS